jgi:spermidine/putrescine transport system permease protein
MGTIIVSHVAFSLPFVVLTVRARLTGFDNRVEEAAADLGANEWTTFWRVTVPLIAPGILSGAMLAFTLSLDDFVITFFTSGPGSTTLPIYVYGLLRRVVTPEVNALSTLWILAVLVAVSISQWFQNRE